MKPYMINQNDLFEEAQNFVRRVECWNGKVFEMKDLDEMKEINLNLAFDITFTITNGRLLYSFIKENFT